MRRITPDRASDPGMPGSPPADPSPTPGPAGSSPGSQGASEAGLQPDRLAFSVAECARLLGVGKNTIYAAVHSGRLPAMRLSSTGAGAHVRISRKALLAFVEQEGTKQ